MTLCKSTDTSKTVRCKSHVKRLKGNWNAAALNEIISRQRQPLILGGNDADCEHVRFSYWAIAPAEVFEVHHGSSDPFAELEKIICKYKLTDTSDLDLPKEIFIGGWAGYFSYELGWHIENIPQKAIDDLHMPVIRLCFYDRLICYEHQTKNWMLLAIEMDNDAVTIEQKFQSLQSLLSESEKIVALPLPTADIENIAPHRHEANMDNAYYLKAVTEIKQLINDGEVYQVNFSQRFTCENTGTAIDLYNWQNRYNPCAYSAYIDSGDFQIVSTSPELFFKKIGSKITTEPIKGTRPRLPDTAQNRKINEKNIIELETSEKELAELDMIIDLERNDLGRICKYGTIKVTNRRRIDAHPTVFHAAATIEGQLRPHTTFCDILKAMFPGGSITGAPKVSAMEIIDRTEPSRRGVYTGSIGYIALDGNVCLNIAIRTIIITPDKTYAQAGGGIVADSDAQAEWQESICKARALLAGIEAIGRERK